MSSLHILTRRSRFRLRPFRPALRPLADLAGLGSAAFLNECSSGLVLVVFNLLTLRLAGTLGVAAYGIVANLALMALALFTGVNQGVQPLVSLAHGRGDAAGVRTLCRMALGLALCAGLCMAALAFFAAGPLVSLFNRDGDPALQQMAEQGLRLYFLGFPFAGLNLVTASFLGAAEHPSRSLRLSLLRGFVAIVAAALVAIALSASAGLRALLLAMDKLYGLEHPGGLRRIALSVILSLLFLLTIYLSVVVIFTGDWFFHLLETHLPHPLLRLIPLSALSSLWLWIRYLLLFCFVLLLVLAIYRLGTPRRFRSSRKLLLSSLFTAVSLVAGSLLFSWFIGLSSRYSMLYGSLASLIILLVWLYFWGNVLLLGALLSRVLEVRRARHHSTGS